MLKAECITVERQIYIYALRHPSTLEIRYVGKTLDIDRRLSEHIIEQGCNRKCRWIQSLLNEGLTPVIETLEAVTQENWQERERWWISYYRDLHVDLCNLTDGGDGLCGCTDETRAKMSIKQKEQMQNEEYKAKIFTPERASKISRALSGKPKSSEHIAKLPQNNPGRHLSEEHKQKLKDSHKQRVYSKRSPLSEDHKSKLKQASQGNSSRLGMKNSDEMNQKIGKAIRGIKRSDETKERMRQAKLKYWQERKEKENEIQPNSKSDRDEADRTD